MTSLAEILKENDSTRHHGEALEKVADIAELVGESVGYYKAAKEIGAALGLWDAPKSEFAILSEKVDALRDAIVDSFKELASLTNAQFEILHAQNLDEQIGRSRTVIQEIADQRADPNQLDVPVMLMEARGAVTTIEGGSYWKTPLHDVTTYRDEWSGPVPRPIDWNYMLALPVYLEALVTWMATVRLLDPDEFPQKYAASFQARAEFLAEAVSTIVTGIHQLAAPTLEEAKPRAELLPWSRQVATYTNAAWMYSNDPGMPKTAIIGAADPWTTFSSIEVSSRPPYAPGEWSHIGPSWVGHAGQEFASWNVAFDAWFHDEITLRHAIRTSRNWKTVYGASGVGKARAVLSRLWQLAGQGPVYRVGRDDAWSLREIVDDLPSDHRPPHSLRALAQTFNLPTPSLRAVTDVPTGSSSAWGALDRRNHPEWES